MYKADIFELAGRTAQAVMSLVQFLLHATLQVIWSDEAHIVMGNLVFYPAIAATLLLMAGRVSPPEAIKKCKCYCLKQLHKVRLALQRSRSWLVPANALMSMLQTYYM